MRTYNPRPSRTEYHWLIGDAETPSEAVARLYGDKTVVSWVATEIGDGTTSLQVTYAA